MSRWSGALKNSGYRCIMMGEGSMCKGRTINSIKKTESVGRGGQVGVGYGIDHPQGGVL